MHLKQVYLIIILILALELAAAQSGIDVILKTYDSTTHQAKIQIKNLDDVDYHDIYLIIDTWAPVKIVDTLGASSSAITPKIIPPGEHVLKVPSKEGISVEKKLNFLKTTSLVQGETDEAYVPDTTAGSIAEKEAQRIKELRAKQQEFVQKLNQEKLTEETVKPEEKTTKPAEKPVQEPKKDNKSLIILIVLLFFIVITYILLRKGKNEN